MTQSYSLDLRVRVVAFVEAGHSCRAARHFGVSDSFAIKLLQRQRTFGSPTPTAFALRGISDPNHRDQAGDHHARTRGSTAGGARDRSCSCCSLSPAVPARLHL
jgi:hypothetical protein